MLMSFSGGQRSPLLAPLAGRTATFLVEGRQANIRFARALMDSMARAGVPCVVLDLDALYSSNADLIFAGLSGDPAMFTVKVPAPGSDIETEFASIFNARPNAIAIDSLNSLYHLISMEDGSSRGRKLMFALESLSQLARANGTPVTMSMYRREGLAKPGRGRSISSLSDVTASVEVRGSGLEIRAERGSAWPGGVFSTRIP